MAVTIKAWDGDEWETHVKSLLRLRHGPGNFFDVPAAHKGDFGLEGFSTNGFAYQAYAAQEPISIGDLHKKQVAKITEDITKFIDNKAKLSAIFGSLTFSRWSLLVPRHESGMLLAHAATKSKQVLAAGLSYVNPDFRIIIETEKDYELQVHKLVVEGLTKLVLDHPAIKSEAIGEWASSNNPLVNALDTKIKKLKPNESNEKRRQLRDEFIKLFIVGTNISEDLRQKAPEWWEKVIAIKRSREQFLALESQMSTDKPTTTWRKELDRLDAEFKERIPVLDDQAVRALAHEAISDWLMRCPMDFC